jgi:hypothetical protein
MSTITFDTLKFAERLEKAGVPRDQAKAEAEALVEVLETGTQDLVTKHDLNSETTALRAEVREMRADIMGEIRLSRWMLAALGGLAVANFAKQFFEPCCSTTPKRCANASLTLA